MVERTSFVTDLDEWHHQHVDHHDALDRATTDLRKHLDEYYDDSLNVSNEMHAPEEIQRSRETWLSKIKKGLAAVSCKYTLQANSSEALQPPFVRRLDDVHQIKERDYGDAWVDQYVVTREYGNGTTDVEGDEWGDFGFESKYLTLDESAFEPNAIPMELSDEVVSALIRKSEEHDSSFEVDYARLQDSLVKLEGVHASNELARQLIETGRAAAVLKLKNLFPDLQLNAELAELMRANGSLSSVFEYQDRFDGWQMSSAEARDIVVSGEWDALTVLRYLDKIDGMELTYDDLKQCLNAKEGILKYSISPSVLEGLSKIKGVSLDNELFKLLQVEGDNYHTKSLVSTGLFRNLPASVAMEMMKDAYSPSSLLENIQSFPDLNNADKIELICEKYNSMAGLKSVDQSIQKEVVRRMLKKKAINASDLGYCTSLAPQELLELVLESDHRQELLGDIGAYSIELYFNGASEESIGEAKKISEQYTPSSHEPPAQLPDYTAVLDDQQNQEASFGTYYPTGNISVNPVSDSETVSVDEMNRLLDTDHCVRMAPRLEDQVKDRQRLNEVTAVGQRHRGLGTKTSYKEYRGKREVMTEGHMLERFNEFTLQLEEDFRSAGMADLEAKAKSLRENLTFIGQKEYKKATEGIANYWKAELNANPELQVFAVAGEIGKDYGQVKSDQYLLDNIVNHFTDEELELYKGRLVVDEKDIKGENPENVKVVLLDDWTISGSQLTNVRTSITNRYPQLANRIEVQLLAAPERRIRIGLGSPGGVSTPVRAYYIAHSAQHEIAFNSGAHITGSHSSVDYDFEILCADLIDQRNNLVGGQPMAMPAGTNIVRPYRMDGYQPKYVDRVKDSVRE